MYLLKTYGKKKKSLIIFLLLFTLLLTGVSYTPVQAYYNQGTVQMTLGANSVQVAKGSKVMVAATMTPASSDQTLGCGMADCPQGCGDEGCGDANGQCRCGGDEYSTYYAGVTLTSADASIASAKYENGVINITGVSVGTTTIYAQGTLRQYTSSSKQAITVTVTSESSSSGNSTATTGSSSTNTDFGGVKVADPGTSSATESEKSSLASAGTQETQQTTLNAEDTQSQTETSSQEASRFCGNKGTFDVIDLTDDTGITGKTELESIKGQEVTAVFQHKDEVGNVLYSWSFNGKDVSEPADIDMRIDFSSDYESQIQKLSKQDGSNVLYLSFAHSGQLPGKARIDIKVGDTYKDGDSLILYYYDENNNTLSLQEKDLIVSNGYVSFEITHCSEYFLADHSIVQQSKSHVVLWSILASGILAAMGGVVVLILRNRTHKEEF